MPRFEQPKPVRTAGLLLLGLAGVGVLQFLAGTLELNHLSANAAALQEKATMLAEAQRAAGRMASSAELAQWLGGIGAVVVLAFRPFFVRAFVFARLLAWFLVIGFLFVQILLMLQDGAIGVQPYIDMSHDAAQEDLINSLVVWPGYFFMIYPAETAGLILPALIIIQLLKEDVFEFFRLRKKVTTDGTWSVEEILAKRANGSGE